MKNSINENGQCAGKGNGDGDGYGYGNNGAAHELKRKSLLNQRQGRRRGGGAESCAAAALANRKSALPKICAEWQLRVLQLESGKHGEREGGQKKKRGRSKKEGERESGEAELLSSGDCLMATRDTQHAGNGSRCLRHSRQKRRRKRRHRSRRRQRCSRELRGKLKQRKRKCLSSHKDNSLKNGSKQQMREMWMHM